MTDFIGGLLIAIKELFKSKKTINYPLLCYQFQDESVLGILVGTEYQVMDKTIKQVKTQLSDFLVKSYKKEDYYPYMDLENPKLKIIEVKISGTITIFKALINKSPIQLKYFT